jgi:WD40 repeat protein
LIRFSNKIAQYFQDGNLVKQWKSVHKGPVSRLALSKDGMLLGSGGTDSNVRIWDLQHHTCTHNLRGAQGVIRFGILLLYFEFEDFFFFFER